MSDEWFNYLKEADGFHTQHLLISAKIVCESLGPHYKLAYKEQTMDLRVGNVTRPLALA